MKHHFTFFGIGILLSTAVFSQESLPYYCDFDEETHESVWEQYRQGNTDELTYTWDFETDQIVHYYPVGGSETTDDWMVSPAFDFSNGATIDSVSHAFSGFGVPMEGDTITICVLFGSADPELATEIVQLKQFSGEDYNPDNLWRTSYAIDIPAGSGEAHIAFRYKTIVNWLDVRFDDLYVSGNPLNVLDYADPAAKLVVFPNPTSDAVQFSSDGLDVSFLSVTDITGRTVLQKSLYRQAKRLDVSALPEGVYIISAQATDGSMAIGKFTVNR